MYLNTKVNLRDRVLGEVLGNGFTSLAGKGSQKKHVCPTLEGVVRSFTAVVQRGRDQLVDILLLG